MKGVVDDALIDAGRRGAEAINLHLLFNNFSDVKYKWMAIRLSDGSCDNVLYDTKADAVNHVVDERWFMYICFSGLGPAGAKPSEVAKLILFWREAYEAGGRFIAPDERAPIMTTQRNDYYTSLMMAKTMRDVERFVRGMK